MRSLALLTGFFLCASSLLTGQERFDAAAHAKVVAPFVDEQTVIVGHADLSRVNVAAIFKVLRSAAVIPEKELEETEAGAAKVLTTLTDLGVKHVYAARGIAGGPGDFYVIIPTPAGVQRAKLIELLRSDRGPVVKVHDDAIVAGPPGAVKLLDNLRAAPRPEIAQAFAAAGDAAIHVAVVVPTTLRRALLETMPALPKELDAASIQVLTKGLHWIALKADTTPEVSLRVLIRAQDKSTAEDLNRVIGKLVGFAKKHLPEFEKLFDVIALKAQDETLVASVTGNELIRAALPLLQQARNAANRAQDINNLRQIAIAMHNYYDTHKGFPTPANYAKKGKALLSWRVHLLPYVDQSQLYQQFKLDEPWDSEHNKKLIPLMPQVYKSPDAKKAAEKGETVYLVPVGPTTIFPGKKAIKFQDITDGTSNTILIVEALEKSAVIWTKPEDWKFDADNPLLGLVDGNRKSFHVALADGSARELPSNIDPKTLAAMFTRNGGEAINLP